eukprot:gene60677-83001_t
MHVTLAPLRVGANAQKAGIAEALLEAHVQHIVEEISGPGLKALLAEEVDAALLAAGVIVTGFALVFPQCLGRPEQVSPELVRTWLDNVREAKPIYKHPFRTAFPIVTLPIIGRWRMLWRMCCPDVAGRYELGSHRRRRLYGISAPADALAGRAIVRQVGGRLRSFCLHVVRGFCQERLLQQMPGYIGQRRDDGKNPDHGQFRVRRE